MVEKRSCRCRGLQPGTCAKGYATTRIAVNRSSAASAAVPLCREHKYKACREQFEQGTRGVYGRGHNDKVCREQFERRAGSVPDRVHPYKNCREQFEPRARCLRQKKKPAGCTCRFLYAVATRKRNATISAGRSKCRRFRKRAAQRAGSGVWPGHTNTRTAANSLSREPVAFAAGDTTTRLAVSSSGGELPVPLFAPKRG